MRSMVIDTASFCQRQAGRASRTRALGAQDQTTGSSLGSRPRQVGSVQAADNSPGRRGRRTPRRVVLETVARRDGAQRLSLALTLLARASRTPPGAASSSRQEDTLA